MGDSPLTVGLERDGRLLRLTLARPKANVIDAAMIAALDTALAAHADDAALCAVVLDHAGPHFSFGASVEEHLPDQCAAMLAGLHALLKRMVDYPVPILAAVKGQCLGGGLEVAMACNLIFAAPDAALGQPEIKLAVFAPAASCLLPRLVGRARAEDLLFSGRSISGREGHEAGLVFALADDPADAAEAYAADNLAGHSASTLRFAVRAAREPFAAAVKADLDRVEELYLSGLMQTRDAVEGLNAFLDKRPAKWEDR
ncbi:MAG: cyclohexa-1,5-dienecarbonyl-CoA hydratase [Hyphomicrobiales bacterium]|nr:cyclohexa-1,5-dienecarbonyl-CoA hydratase [Hyphomicrobiales bacterium]